MNKKVIILLVVVAALAGGWLAFSSWSGGQRAAQRRSLAEEKQKEIDAIPVVTEKSVSNMAISLRKNGAADSNERNTDEQQFATHRDPVLESSSGITVATVKTVSINAPIKEMDVLSGKEKLVYNLSEAQDPTLSLSDKDKIEVLKLDRARNAERARLAKIESDRQARLERERLEREAAALKRDPSIAIRNRIRLDGIVGQEVFINGKIYTVGSTILGARIVHVSDGVVRFSYKGQTFTKSVNIK